MKDGMNQGKNRGNKADQSNDHNNRRQQGCRQNQARERVADREEKSVTAMAAGPDKTAGMDKQTKQGGTYHARF